jgi:hypothetical protein
MQGFTYTSNRRAYPARVRVDRAVFHVLPRPETEFRQHLPAVLQNTRLELVKPRGCASEEQRGGAAEIPSQEGVEHGTRPDLHVLGLSNRTTRKCYGYKYAKMDNPAYL